MTWEVNAIWRLNEEFSVVHAAVLIAGGSPDHNWSGWIEDGSLSYRQDGYDAALAALKAAIRSGSLNARLAYPALESRSSRATECRSFVFVETGEIERQRLEDVFLLDGGTWVAKWADKTVIEREPNWAKSMIKVEALRTWLQSRGITTGFFFLENDKHPAKADSLFDVKHEHFSAELALAVTVWRALENETQFRRGTKAAIERWIEQHSEAWKGENALSDNALDRIVTLVNWRKSGGAPPSGT